MAPVVTQTYDIRIRKRQVRAGQVLSPVTLVCPSPSHNLPSSPHMPHIQSYCFHCFCRETMGGCRRTLRWKDEEDRYPQKVTFQSSNDPDSTSPSPHTHTVHIGREHCRNQKEKSGHTLNPTQRINFAPGWLPNTTSVLSSQNLFSLDLHGDSRQVRIITFRIRFLLSFNSAFPPNNYE